MKRAPSRRRGRRGYTLLETAMAVGVFLVLSYSLVVALDIGVDTRDAVLTRSQAVRSMRATSTGLSDELRGTRDDLITVETLADGNHQLTFQQPIDVAGANGWGVYDKTLGTVWADQNRENWSVRYTVVASMKDGALVRKLMRQVIEDDGSVHSQRIAATDLLVGGGANPGFNVVQTGDVWQITLSTRSQGSDGVTSEVLHVRTRNSN